jgi:alpha-mannosidase
MGGGEDAPRALKSEYPILAPGPVGQRISGLYKDRISQFYSGGQWEKVNLLS